MCLLFTGVSFDMSKGAERLSKTPPLSLPPSLSSTSLPPFLPPPSLSLSLSFSPFSPFSLFLSLGVFSSSLLILFVHYHSKYSHNHILILILAVCIFMHTHINTHYIIHTTYIYVRKENERKCVERVGILTTA